MLGNGVEISYNFQRILGPVVLGWAPNHFVLRAQVALSEKASLYPCGWFVEEQSNTYMSPKHDSSMVSTCSSSTGGRNVTVHRTIDISQ